MFKKSWLKCVNISIDKSWKKKVGTTKSLSDNIVQKIVTLPML